MKKDYPEVYLVFAASLGFFTSTAREYKNDAIKLKNEIGYGGCTSTFHLLSTICFELFPKVLIGYDICLKHKNSSAKQEEIEKEIFYEFKKYNHKIDKLFKRFPDLLTYLDISRVEYISNTFVSEYRFTFKNGKEIFIKDSEGIRYGIFATEKDVAIWCVNDDIIIDTLEKIDNYIKKKEKSVNEELKELFDF